MKILLGVDVHTKTRKKIEQPATNRNELEPTATTWNDLEAPDTKWNKYRIAT